MNRQTRQRPENTVDLIDSPQPDAFDDVRLEEVNENEGILAGIARLLGKGVDEVKSALSLAPKQKEKEYPVTDCGKCGREYRIFEKHYGQKQTMCPACADEAMRPAREKAMRPEKMAAQAELRKQESQEAEKKNKDRQETVELVAQTLAQVLPKLQESGK